MVDTNLKNNQRGFTLVELLVIITVLAILAVSTMPKYATLIKEAKDADATKDVRSIYSILQSYNHKHTVASEIVTLTEKELLELSGIKGNQEDRFYIKVDQNDTLVQMYSKSGHIVMITKGNLYKNTDPSSEELAVFLQPSQFLWGSDVFG